MFETNTTPTYAAAFTRARGERARAFRALLTFRLPALMSGRGPRAA